MSWDFGSRGHVLHRTSRKHIYTLTLRHAHTGEAEESAAAIHFLLKHGYITGQVLGVDGGLGSLK